MNQAQAVQVICSGDENTPFARIHEAFRALYHDQEELHLRINLHMMEQCLRFRQGKPTTPFYVNSADHTTDTINALRQDGWALQRHDHWFASPSWSIHHFPYV